MTTENTENTTSQVSHAGDSTTQTEQHDTGVGSSVWLGRFFDGCEFALITKDWPSKLGEPQISFWAFGHCVGAVLESSCNEECVDRMIAIRDSIRAKLSPELLSELRENSLELFLTNRRPFL